MILSLEALGALAAGESGGGLVLCGAQQVQAVEREPADEF